MSVSVRVEREDRGRIWLNIRIPITIKNLGQIAQTLSRAEAAIQRRGKG